MNHEGAPTQHSVVEKLVKDPTQLPNAKIVAGFIGNSPTDGHIRLYLTPEFNEYIDIPSEAVVHTQSLSASVDPLERSLLWIRSNADLLHTTVQSTRLQAQFLEGSIANGLTTHAAAQNLSPAMVVGHPSIICTHPVFCSSGLCASALCQTKVFCTAPPKF